MKIGLPKGLLYSKYHVFARTFFEELGAEIVTSPDTNKQILDLGVNHCIDEACLPVKVFHGHVAWLKDRCDLLLVPRVMSLQKRRSLCPMFCGLIEMVKSGIGGLPPLICEPVYSLKSLQKWAAKAGAGVTADRKRIRGALDAAVCRQRAYRPTLQKKGFSYKVALIGHTYNIRDAFINMDLVGKLARLDIGVVTEEDVAQEDVDRETAKLFKQPFWYFARRYYGAAVHLFRTSKVDGVVYVSAFNCGVDSIVVELIKDALSQFPMMVLKIDEHTGQAGFDTRIEAFADMLKRRTPVGYHISPYGQHIAGSQSVF